MMSGPFSFATATQIVFGRGVAASAIDQIRDMGSRILLVHGANPARADWLATALSTGGCTVTRCTVKQEPDTVLIESAIAMGRRDSVQVVVALGGGAVIDAGKAIAALVPSTRPMMDHLEVVGLGLPLQADPLPFVALPTTAGTGAEVTKNAVICVPEHKRKVSLRDPKMLPNLAIVDPKLTDYCPKAITLASGLDAITQVIEPYLCTKANPLTDALCRDAIARGLVALQKLMDTENQQARDDMAWVSLCGGLALANSGLGAVHGLAGPLGGLTGAAHGAICGVLLPHALRVNRRFVEDAAKAARMDEVAKWIADAFDCPDTHMDAAADCLASWSRDCGLLSLSALGIDADAQRSAAHSAASSSSMKANPVALSVENLTEIMDAAG